MSDSIEQTKEIVQAELKKAFSVYIGTRSDENTAQAIKIATIRCLSSLQHLFTPKQIPEVRITLDRNIVSVRFFDSVTKEEIPLLEWISKI